MVTIFRNNDTNGGNSGDNLAVIEISDRQQLILSCITKNSYIAAKQMAVMTKLSLRTIQRELSILQNMKILQHEGPARTGKWVILDTTYLSKK